LIAVAKLTKPQWQAAREQWEADSRDGFDWLATELNGVVSRQAISKKAKHDGWSKGGTQVAQPQNESFATKPNVAQPKPQLKTKAKIPASQVDEPEWEEVDDSVLLHGRPTLYKPEYDKQVYKLCLLGATDAELADFFNVTEQTINNWKHKQPSFFESLKRGKTYADANVACSLYQRAIGYSHPDTDIKCFKGEIIQTEIIKHYPPDTGAAFIWLKNRNPSKWKDKIELKEDINLNIFPPKEELDAIYEKALSEAEKRDAMLSNRRERLGIRVDNNFEIDQ